MQAKDKIILDLCGGTGSWSKPYKSVGYDVRLITLPDFDIRAYKPPENVYGILAAPPCTMFSWARTRGNKKRRDLREGMELVKRCLEIIWEVQYEMKNQYAHYTSMKFWVLENPFSLLNSFLGKPAFIFHPYEFGDGYSKKTCLWGNFNEPVKTHTKENGRMVSGKKFDQLLMPEIRSIGDNIFRETSVRQELRGITPQGFARAFFLANQ